MDEMFERLKSEVEEERRRIYLERFGQLSAPKEEKIRPNDFN
jgi:hypothetical protein